jgi:hypothetical protein
MTADLRHGARGAADSVFDRVLDALLSGQIDEKPGCRIDVGHQQVVRGHWCGRHTASGARCRRPLRDRLVGNTPDPLLYRGHLVFACHDSDGAEFQPLGPCIVPIEMRPAVVSIFSANSTAAANATVAALLARFNSALVAHDDPDFVSWHPLGDGRRAILGPYGLSIGIGEGLDDGFDAVEGWNPMHPGFRERQPNGSATSLSISTRFCGTSQNGTLRDLKRAARTRHT